MSGGTPGHCRTFNETYVWHQFVPAVLPSTICQWQWNRSSGGTALTIQYDSSTGLYAIVGSLVFPNPTPISLTCSGGVLHGSATTPCEIDTMTLTVG